jgi:hypothetical protein
VSRRLRLLWTEVFKAVIENGTASCVVLLPNISQHAVSKLITKLGI